MRSQAPPKNNGTISTFAPQGINTLIRYADLEGGFLDDYECKLDLGAEKKEERFSATGKKAQELAILLNNALSDIENVINQGQDAELARYFQTKLNSYDNRGPPVRVRVNSQLPLNAARYYNKKLQEVEIILNQDFAFDLLGASNTYPEAVVTILGERLFHELCHTNNDDVRLAIPHEAHRIERDRQLHNLIVATERQQKIEQYLREIHPLFRSGYYFKFLKELNRLDDQLREVAISRYLQRENPVTTAANLSVALGRIDLGQLTSAKMIIYSGPPGGNKHAVRDSFASLFGRHIQRFVLFHTRRMRPGETQDLTYYFRSETHIRQLEQEGKIITAYVNNELQGLAIVSFDDNYIDPETNENKSVNIIGLDAVLKGDKLVIIECGLALFMALKSKYPTVHSIFISPYENDYLEQASHDPKLAFEAIIGKESALRIHHREWQEARRVAKDYEKDPNNAKFYKPTPQREYIDRINEAVKQVRQRHEYQVVLVNEWVSKDQLDQALDDLTENFAGAIFSNLLKAMEIPFDEEASADEMVMLLASVKLKSKESRAKFVIYSGPPGGGKGEVWKRFMARYGQIENIHGEKLITKFRLFHTRERRITETQNQDYYFRDEGHLYSLKRDEGKILISFVNKNKEVSRSLIVASLTKLNGIFSKFKMNFKIFVLSSFLSSINIFFIIF